ncbi:MAG: energy-coupling factor transporter ATPase [Clostridia bacterium]|nr:energy-coupling factor transporter ATPase [Clostridia bacterium]
MPFIETKNLSFTYTDEDDPQPVLHEVSLSFEKGEFVAILGRNGSGKSTFAKLLNLVLEATDGTITIDGKSVHAELSEAEIIDLRKKVGMVFQNPDNQLVATVVEEDVAFGPENLGIEPAEIRRRVDEALEIVGMTDYARHAPHKLSGGQKQRIAIAGVIAMLPDCILFDESTAMLDPRGRAEVMETVEKLNREQGITVLLITHNMDEAVRADRVVVIDDGRVQMDGTPREVFAKVDELFALGLAVPQATELAARLELSGVPLTPVEGADAVENWFNT